MKNRIGYIDNLKGFAIVLVVLGHLIQYITVPDNYLYDGLWRWIYSFHMQLFVMISGMTVGTELLTFKDIPTVVSRRFLQLIVPFIVWTILFSLSLQDFSFIQRAIIDPGVGYWFLWDLFFISVAFSLAVVLHNQTRLNLLLSIGVFFLLLVLLSVFLRHRFDSGRIYRLYPFYVLGYYISKVNWKTRQLHFLAGGIILHCFLAMIWFPIQPSSSITPYRIINHFLSSLPFRFLVSLIGCISYYSLFRVIGGLLDNSWLNRLGRLTLGIYTFHLLIVRLSSRFFIFPHINNNLLQLLFLFALLVLLLSISYYVVSYISKNRVMGLLFLGRLPSHLMK